MSPKRVWGIILIVLAMVTIVHGLDRYHSMKVAANGVRSVDAAGSNLAAMVGVKSADSTDSEAHNHREEWLSMMTVLMGMALSIIGTFMIKEERPKPSIDLYEDVYMADLDRRPFKL
jgi:uncharacterized membrane protein YidH (DUF202 family)